MILRLARAPVISDATPSLAEDVACLDPATFLVSMLLQRVQDDHGIPSAAISALAPVRIGDLAPGARATGRVLHGFLAADALKIDGGVQVLTVLEDSSGESVLLAIKHAATSSATDVEVRSKFPRGARVAVKEPTLARPLDDLSVNLDLAVLLDDPGTGPGTLSLIALDNPANVEVLSFLGDDQLQRFRGMSHSTIRMEGNKLTKDGSFEAAAQAYGLIITSQDDSRDRMLALANQAACYLKLGRFEACINAASAALEMDPNHLKSLYRKALALLKLHLYDWSCQLLKDFAGKDQAIQELYIKCQKLAWQSRDSSSIAQEISSFLRAWSDASDSETKAPPKFPELAEYVGPVEIKMCGDQSKKRGRGLFATRKINRGELLVVSNAVIFERGDDQSACNRDAATRLLDMAMKSPRAYKQLLTLVCGVPGDEREVPAMEIFQPNWTTPEAWPISSTDSTGREALQGIDVQRTCEIVSKAAFNPRYSKGLIYVATWFLPSFINHSCVPNVCQTVLGTSACYFAARDIAAGEELVHCYINSGHPYRRKRLASFECDCKKCHLETLLDEDLVEVNGYYRDLAEANFEFQFKKDPEAGKVVKKLEDVLASKLQDEEDRQCLRAIHWSLYLYYYQRVESGAAVPVPGGGVPAAEVIMAAMHKFSAASDTNLAYMKLLVEFARDKDAAWSVIEREWEIKLGRQDDHRVVKAIVERGTEIITV
ncbi:uncharacterized protein LOC112349041 [Selaginella moellendorffii]|nr:uncharacterized protein LOC112349041 [Selaginella moellendorffii]|eukprot:XP_024538395.1 uncharacterized protein LOC112349041 [Selaginella moellendorffii]